MLTLPANFISNFARPAVYVIRMTIQNGGVQAYLYISSAAFGGVTLKYNGTAVGTIHTEYFSAKVGNGRGEEETVPGLSEVDASANIQQGGGCMAFTETSVTLLNQSDFGASSGDIENQPIEIYEGRMPASGSLDLVSDCILRFKGRSRNSGLRNSAKWQMTCVDRRLVETRPVPVSRLTKSTYPYMQDANNSKAVPLFFGDFTYVTLFIPSQLVSDLLPCICVDTAAQKYVLADTDIQNTSGVGIYYNDSQGVHGLIVSGITQGVENGFSYIQFASSPLGHGVPTSTIVEFYIFPQWLGAQGDFINLIGDYHLLVDTDPTTLCHFASDGSTRYSYVAFPKLSLTGYTVPYSASSSFKVHVESANRTGAAASIYIRKRSSSNAAVSLGTLSSDSQTFDVNPASVTDFPNGFSFDILWDVEIGIATPATSALDIKYICLFVEGPVPGLGTDAPSKVAATRSFGTSRTSNPVTAYLQGLSVSQWKVPEAAKTQYSRLFVSAWGPYYPSVMRSGRAYNPGLPVRFIDCAPAVIEWLLRYRLGIQTADIDTASFDATYAARNQVYWPFLGTIQAQQDAFEIIRQICFEFSMLLLVTSAGQYRLVPLDSGTPVYTIQPNDVAWDEMEGPRIQVDFTPNDAIVNDLFIDYKLDYSTNEPRNNIYVSDINGDGTLEHNILADSGSPRSGSYSSWLSDSVSRYCSIRQLQYTFQFIRDQIGAENALKKLADWLAFKRMIVRMDLVRNLNTIPLEVGDILKINLGQVTATNKNFTPYLVTRVLKSPVQVEDGENIITLECEEIPNANTGMPGSDYMQETDVDGNAETDVDTNAKMVMV
jgi:hypothetical protein